MKKKTIVIIAVLVLAVVFWKWFFNQPCLPPERPDSVPKEAIWKGDCDGGNWIELVNIDKDNVRFRIYRDWNGDLILDADFKYENCQLFRLTESNWSNHVAYFDEGIEIYDKSGSENCRLSLVFPPHYEEPLK